jgi:Iap family predicted aminopeptidase
MAPKVDPLDVIRRLAVGIGPRLGGSDASHRAAEYIAEVLDQIGLVVRTQTFSYLGWEYDRMPTLELTAPIEERVRCAARAYSLATDRPVEGRVWSDGHVDQIPGVFEWRRLAVGHAGEREASILISPTPGLPPWPLPDNDVRFREPCLCITSEDGDRILAMMKTGEVRVRLETFGHDVCGLTDSNVIGLLEADESDRIAISSHYDTAWNAPGAVDNASGVAVMVETAQRMIARRPECGFEFIAFAAEEWWLYGSHYFVKEAVSRDEIGSYKAVVNCDPLGPGDRLECWVGPESLRKLADEVQHTLGTVEHYPMQWRDPVDGSDHYPFWLAGVPACFPIFMPHTPEYHQPTDTIDLVQLPKLEIIMDVVEAIARRLASVPRLLVSPADSGSVLSKASAAAKT